MSRDDFMKYAVHSKELLSLEANIKKHATDNANNADYCANAEWYGYRGPGFKRRMCELVGWDARNSLLCSDEAYDVVYQYLYDLLPNCKHDGICC